MPVLGFHGPPGSGKSHAARLAAAQWIRRTPHVHVYAFGCPLKRVAAVLNDRPLDAIHDAEFKSTLCTALHVSKPKCLEAAAHLASRAFPQTVIADVLFRGLTQRFDASGVIVAVENEDFPRTVITIGRLLQILGTDILRAAHPDVFVAHADEHVRSFPAHHRWIFEDVRFLNEWIWIEETMGGHVVRVQRIDAHGNEVEDDGAWSGRQKNHASERNLPCRTVMVNDSTAALADHISTVLILF